MPKTPLPSEIDDPNRERARSLKNLRNARYRERQKAMARPTSAQVDTAMMLAVLRLQRVGFLPQGTVRQIVLTATEILSGDGHREVSPAVNQRTVELGAASLRPAASVEGADETTPADTPVTPSLRSSYPTSRIVDPTQISGRRLEARPAGATF